MNKLYLQHITHVNHKSGLDAIKKSVEEAGVPEIPLDQINWPDYPYLPETHFKIALIKDGFYLYFRVREGAIRGVVTEDNADVYNDSCVEFFLNPTGEGYYNLEFNCIGRMLLAYGIDRHNRQLASRDVLSMVILNPSLGREPIAPKSGKIDWDIDIIIPFECFFRHRPDELIQKSMFGNFYKCGNKDIMDHYVTWSRIESASPDFHRPEFFGQIEID